jgi:hypothetical protein
MTAWLTWGSTQYEYLYGPKGPMFTRWMRTLHGMRPDGTWPEVNEDTGEVR